MYFQAIDDKSHCVGVYYSGHLIFDEDKMPKSFSNGKTWKYSGILFNMVGFFLAEKILVKHVQGTSKKTYQDNRRKCMRLRDHLK